MIVMQDVSEDDMRSAGQGGGRIRIVKVRW